MSNEEILATIVGDSTGSESVCSDGDCLIGVGGNSWAEGRES